MHRAALRSRVDLNRSPAKSVPTLITAARALAEATHVQWATFSLATVAGLLTAKSAEELADLDRGVLDDLLELSRAILPSLPEAAWLIMNDCLTALLAMWVVEGTLTPDAVVGVLQFVKGRGLSADLITPGPKVLERQSDWPTDMPPDEVEQDRRPITEFTDEEGIARRVPASGGT